MSDLDIPTGMALACKRCGWRPDEDLAMGVVAAHFETEHDTDQVELELIVVCPRCDKPMAFFASWGNEDHFTCESCRRGRKVRRSS